MTPWMALLLFFYPQSLPLGGIPVSSGGGGTITYLTPNTCYPATSCSITVASGDLVVAFAGAFSGTAPSMTSSQCSSSGSGTQTTSTYVSQVFWCIANTASVTISASPCGATDCGLELLGMHSTTGWNTASVLTNQTEQTATPTSLTQTCPSLSPTGSAIALTCYLLDESNSLTGFGSVDSSYLQGPQSTTQSNFSVYRINAATGTYAPNVTLTGTAHKVAIQALSMAAN